jgi:hypothetical protein
MVKIGIRDRGEGNQKSRVTFIFVNEFGKLIMIGAEGP